jgi:hypothetical protein
VTVLAPGPPDWDRRLNGRVVVVFPRLSELAARITIEPEVADEKGYLQRAFAPSGIQPDLVLTGLEPGPEDIAEAAARAAGADSTIVFLYDAHLFPTQRALLDALQGQARALAVVLLRDPYDAAFLRPGVLGVTAWGFRRCQLDAVIARLTYPQPARC